MIDVLISDVFSQGNQLTSSVVAIYPGCAIWHLIRRGKDLFLGSDCCGLLTCQKHTDGLLQGERSGKQTLSWASGFVLALFHSGSPYLLTWKVTVLQLCVSRERK